MAESITRQFSPGEQLSCSTGKAYTFVLRQPPLRFVLDGHSHIQSGACCPLPLLWRQNAIAGTFHMGRSAIDAVGPVVVGDGGKLQKKTTEQIAAALVDEIAHTFDKDSPLRTKQPEDFFASAIIMPMDMDYAHIAGFPSTGTTIYHCEGKKVCYYQRKNAQAPEKDGKSIDMSRERPNMVWVYQQYKAQIDATIAAILKAPWTTIPMFHYDPRRWCNATGGILDKNSWTHGPWDFPFDQIATISNPGIFIGFKMYPPLGYKPLDHRLPHLADFYSKCETAGIPILTHCSPGGLVTHEDKFYHQLDRADLAQRSKENVERIISYDPATPEGYFMDEYVHPKNWRKVLEKFPKLKLCLAHFGGDEWKNTGIESDWIREIVNLTKEFPNVYTDMSCYNFKNHAMKHNIQVLLQEVRDNPDYRHLADKLIFGVDWYLSLITGAPHYKEYVESFYTMMKEIDVLQWQRSTVVNPARFYGLDKVEIVDKMNVALEDKKANRDKRIIGYKKMLKIKEYIATLNKKSNF